MKRTSETGREPQTYPSLVETLLEKHNSYMAETMAEIEEIISELEQA